jgi:hypothetical protein
MARLPVDAYTFPWFDADDCPCLSGDAFVRCCKVGAKRLPHVKNPNLAPPGDATGYAHPKCYMSGTNNCSEGKSREHYVSEAILERFDKLNVSGMPWQKKGETKILPVKSLVANILCERHNNAMAPIDTLGLRAFDALTWASDYAVTSKHPGRARHYLMSGEGLELWMFKLAAGIHFGGIAMAEGGTVRDKSEFLTDEVVTALSTGALPPKSGLWVSQQPGLIQRAQIGVAPLLEAATDRHLGVQVQFGPLQFFALIATPAATEKEFEKLARLRRPRVIDFNGPARDARVVLSWPGWPNQVGRLGVELSPDLEGAESAL